MPFNDVSARDLQTQTSQWTVGKSPDTFGPYLVLDRAMGRRAQPMAIVVDRRRVLPQPRASTVSA